MTQFVKAWTCPNPPESPLWTRKFHPSTYSNIQTLPIRISITSKMATTITTTPRYHHRKYPFIITKPYLHLKPLNHGLKFFAPHLRVGSLSPISTLVRASASVVFQTRHGTLCCRASLTCVENTRWQNPHVTDANGVVSVVIVLKIVYQTKASLWLKTCVWIV